jgi:hypothetical protein
VTAAHKPLFELGLAFGGTCAAPQQYIRCGVEQGRPCWRIHLPLSLEIQSGRLFV